MIIDQIQSGVREVTDRTRMFGYSAGLPNMNIDPKKSNLKCNPIDGGVLLPFFGGKDGYKGDIQPNGAYRQLYLDIPPSEYAYRVDRMFREGVDMGYRTLKMLTQLPHELPPPRPQMPRSVDPITRRQDGYELAEWNKRINAYDSLYNDEWYKQNDQAYAYFNTIHPVLTECEFGLNKLVQLNDPGTQPGTLFFQHCPTCRLAHLKSNECSEAVFAASDVMDSKILLELRETLIAANEAALSYANANVNKVLGDISKRMTGSDNGRSTLNTIERIHLQMQHKTENAKEDSSTTMIRTLAQEMAMTMKQNVVEVPTLSADELEEYRELKAKKLEAQERMAKAREARLKTEVVNEVDNGSNSND